MSIHTSSLTLSSALQFLTASSNSQLSSMYPQPPLHPNHPPPPSPNLAQHQHPHFQHHQHQHQQPQAQQPYSPTASSFASQRQPLPQQQAWANTQMPMTHHLRKSLSTPGIPVSCFLTHTEHFPLTLNRRCPDVSQRRLPSSPPCSTPAALSVSIWPTTPKSTAFQPQCPTPFHLSKWPIPTF